MKNNMATLETELPQHCRIENRGHYADVYFKVHPKDRPEGWPPTVHLGRTDKTPASVIIENAEDVALRFALFKQNLEDPRRIESIKGTLPNLVVRYKKSEAWGNLSDSFKTTLRQHFDEIKRWSHKAGHPHLSKMDTKSINKWLTKFKKTPHRRKELLGALRRLYALAVNEGDVEDNLAAKIELPKINNKNKRKLVLWSETDLDKFVKACDARRFYSLGSIATTSIETTQRLGDTRTMIDKQHYKDGRLNYVQSKTGAIVRLPPTEKLQRRFELYPPGQFIMFPHENTGKVWTKDNLGRTARKILNDIGMKNHVLAELRHSQMNYLFEIGCTENEIASFTGHTIETVKAMMDAHYVETRNEALAEQVVIKINEARRQKVTQIGNTRGNTNV